MTRGADVGGPSPDEIAREASASIVAYAGRLRATGMPLAGVLLTVLGAAADLASDLSDDEYDTLMTSVAAWVIESYADGRVAGAALVPPPRSV